jgi:hypothetical protein
MNTNLPTFIKVKLYDCPAFMGLGVGAIPQEILERYMSSGIVQIIGAAIFTAGAGLSVYGAITKYSS